MAFKIGLMVCLLLLQYAAGAQNAYFNTEQEIFQINYTAGLCSTPVKIPYNHLVNPDGIFSLAVHNDTLYFLSTRYNNLYQMKIGDTLSCRLLGSMGPTVQGIHSTSINNLVVNNDGVVYAIDIGFTTILKTYNPYNGDYKEHCCLPIRPSGDLMFYGGKLFYASDGIYQINLDNTSASSLYMETPGYLFYGLISVPYNCSGNKVYGITFANGTSTFVELNLDTKTIGAAICSLPVAILDAASNTDDGSTNGVTINKILLQPSCNTIQNNGPITVKAATASPGPLMYSLDGTITNNNGLFTGVGFGTHSLHIANSNGCTYDSSFNFTQGLTQGSLQVAVTNNTGCIKANGSISINAAGARYLPLTYNMDASGPVTGGNFKNMPAGQHTFTVTDAAGCKADSSAVIAAQKPPPLFPGITVAAAKCTGKNGWLLIQTGTTIDTAVFTVTVNGAPPQHAFFLEGLDPGSYRLQSADSNGCTIDTTVYIPLLTDGRPAIIITTADQHCLVNNGSAALSITGTAAPYFISFNGTAFSAQNTYSNLAPGTYSIEIKNENTCLWDTSATIQPYVLQPHKTTVTTSRPTCLLPAGGSIKVEAKGLQTPYNYWLGNIANAAGNALTGLGAGNYTLVITNGDKCPVDTLNITLQLVNDGSCDTVYVPAAFTPNGDAVNNMFKPFASPLTTIESFEIYNRFGQKMFEGAGMGIHGWDGAINGKKQPYGAYVWFCRYKLQNGITRLIKGTVVLIR